MSLQQTVLLHLRELILRGEFEPGQRLAEQQLAEQLGASRTPVRAALGILEQEGLVRTNETGGFVVRQFTPREVADAIAVRGHLGGMAARLVAEHGLNRQLALDLQACLDALKPLIPTLGIEVGPMEDDQYAEIVRHGAEGLVVYQETYHRRVYQTLHTAGPKKNFDWRLDCPERAYAGGFRRIGIGALFGLADWKFEALALCAHLEYLYRHCWKAQFTVAFPRMRPYAGNYQYETDVDLLLPDRALVRLITVFRIIFPHVGIVVSTREPAPFRDAVAALGATHFSAGARTEPGGYTGAGHDDLHLTVKGRRVELETKSGCEKATEQFRIHDTRSAAEVAEMLRGQGIDPVWKDWDEALLAADTGSA